MTITYTGRSRHSAGLVVLLLSCLAFGQSLEDKVLEARILQAQSMSRSEAASLDSLINEKKAATATNGRARQAPPRAQTHASAPIDSLIAGPGYQDSIVYDEPDTIWIQDSLGKFIPRPRNAKPLARRYEQRLFGSMDAAAFTGAAGSAGREYVLGPGDEITVSLWGDKEKQYDLTLNKDGKVFLEGVGVVALAGNNLDQAQVILKQRLTKVYSGIARGTSHIEVTLGKAGPIRVFVLGEVKKPGGFVFSGQTSVLSAVYFAKGPTDIGTVRDMQLTRNGAKFSLDLYKYLLKGETLTPHALQDGDIIFSGRAQALVTVEGDVGRPATYELKKGEGVKELLDYAGGLNTTAADQRMTLQRIGANGKPDWSDLVSPQEYLSGKAKMELRDGDRIHVSKSAEQGVNFLTISGPVKYPGTYTSEGVTTVAQLVTIAGGLQEDAYLGRVHVLRFNPDGSSNLVAYSLDSTTVETVSLRPRDNVILYSLREMYLPDSVQIAGAVFKPGRYEYRAGMAAKDLVMQAGGFLPHHEAGKLLVFRGNGHERKVEQIDLAVSEGLDQNDPGFQLAPNDFVQVPVDARWYRQEIVTLEGLFLHPGKYALLYPGEKLSSVVARAGGFKENAYVEGGRFFRHRDSVGRVGVDISTAMAKPRSKTNLPLVGGDSIFIPERLNTVKIIGEVGFETSVLFKDGATVQFYIEKAGGFTRRSEKERVVVQYANGETSRDGYFNRKPDAGSVIYVPQGPEPKPVDWFGGINAILGTMGVALAVILSIQAINGN